MPIRGTPAGLPVYIPHIRRNYSPSPPDRGAQLPKIIRNLTVQYSVSENIDVDSFVSVDILSSASRHALLVYEKGFDALGVRERIGWLGRLNPVCD